MANLLPAKEIASLKLEQRRRLRAAVFLLVTWLSILGAILLVPTGFALLATYESLGQRLESTKRLIEREKDANTGIDLAVMKEKMGIIGGITTRTAPHELIERMVDLAPAGVTLDQVSFMRDDLNVTLILVGGATSRSSLVAFGDALEASGLFTDVVIPIESLAQNTNLRFRLTLTLSENAPPLP